MLEVVAEVKQRQKKYWAVLPCPPAASSDPGENKQLWCCTGMSKLRYSTFYGLFSRDSFLIGYNAVPRMSLRKKGGCMNKVMTEHISGKKEIKVRRKSCFPLFVS